MKKGKYKEQGEHRERFVLSPAEIRRRQERERKRREREGGG
jgi:hypothetical protein